MLELRNVCKQLGQFRLQDINVSIKDHEYIVILGPSGTGKTLLLEIIAGMYQPDGGEILFMGNDITGLDPEDRQIGFVYQDYLLFPHLNVRENILFGLKLKKMRKNLMEEKLEYIADLLKIRHLLDRYQSTLSGGEQQRAAIARALITSPKLLLLDEPLSALDPQTRVNFQQELKQIHKRSKTITIHITHDFSEAIALADRIVVMHNGSVKQIGTPMDIFYEPQSEFLASFIGTENIYEGEVVQKGTGKTVKINDVEFSVITECEGLIRVTIRPEDIILSTDHVKSSAQNCIKGEITEILTQGALVKVRLDTGIPIVVLITKASAENLKIMQGQTIYAVFKTTAVHAF